MSECTSKFDDLVPSEIDLKAAPKLESAYSALKNDIPSVVKVGKAEKGSATNTIKSMNKQVVEQFLELEKSHLIQQRRVGWVLAITIVVQLLVFNGLVYLVTIKNIEINKLNLLLNFMKYYTGAVIVELLGLYLIVVKSVFSTNIGKIVENLFKTDKQK